jgi:hypothetical protein
MRQHPFLLMLPMCMYAIIGSVAEDARSPDISQKTLVVVGEGFIIAG